MEGRWPRRPGGLGATSVPILGFWFWLPTRMGTIPGEQDWGRDQQKRSKVRSGSIPGTSFRRPRFPPFAAVKVGQPLHSDSRWLAHLCGFGKGGGHGRRKLVPLNPRNLTVNSGVVLRFSDTTKSPVDAFVVPTLPTTEGWASHHLCARKRWKLMPRASGFLFWPHPTD